MSSFDTAFDHVIGIEAGYVNDPRDNGGETKYGICKRSYPHLDIKNLTILQAKEIYKRDFWDKIGGDRLPFALAEYLFDYAVNSGPVVAVRALQRVLRIKADGIVGDHTIFCVMEAGADDVIRGMFIDRALIFANHEDLSTFGKGWYGRLFDVTKRYFYSR